MEEWSDRSVPPPKSSIRQKEFDCSDNFQEIFGIDSKEMPTHAGYHYCSTAVEWYHLIGAIRSFKGGDSFQPQVSLEDGLAAVQMGIQATASLVNHDP